MMQCSSRPLAADVTVFLMICFALASRAAGQDIDACRGELVCDQIPANELEGVFDSQNGAVTGRRLLRPNLAVAAVLSRLDIDSDGVIDNADDTDGDGLPDNWEVNGFEALTATGESLDRVVFFPAPTPIVPGTPPTPIFTRLQVATSALNPDTDGDGLSDFIEVFGLMFIDDNANGLLDGSEWNDKNGDGLPSPGEHPRVNDQRIAAASGESLGLLHDFDGFVFTDPTNSDTDGDSIVDGQDNDPLINPRAFGNTGAIIVRFNAEGNDDIDKDGLGNGMDMGNDLVEGEATGLREFQVIDNPENVAELLDLFRQDLVEQEIVPESAIEDLFGADWDGNGLWRTTDVRTWSLVIDEGRGLAPPRELFVVSGRELYAEQTFDELAARFNDDPSYDKYGGRGIGLGWQDLLEPAAGATPFIPDPKVWAILYSWRMPGFDIDGDGFVGAPTISSTEQQECATIFLRPAGAEVTDFIATHDCPTDPATHQPFDDRMGFARAGSGNGGADQPADPTKLDGRIVAPPGFPCAGGASTAAAATLFMLAALRLTRRK